MGYDLRSDTRSLSVQSTHHSNYQSLVQDIERAIQLKIPGFSMSADNPQTGNYSGIIGGAESLRLFSFRADETRDPTQGPKVHITNNKITEIPDLMNYLRIELPKLWFKDSKSLENIVDVITRSGVLSAEDNHNYLILNIPKKDIREVAERISANIRGRDYVLVNLAVFKPDEVSGDDLMVFFDMLANPQIEQPMLVDRMSMLRSVMNLVNGPKLVFVTNSDGGYIDAFNKGVDARRWFMNVSAKFMEYENDTVIKSERNGFYP